MTFFEQELKKLFGDGQEFLEPKIIGNTCYGKLTDQIRVRIQFRTGIVADCYDRLNVTLINRNQGPIDSMTIMLRDVWGMKRMSNRPSEKVSPYIWTNNQDVEWYGFTPTEQDDQKIKEAVGIYLDTFREPQEKLQFEQKI